MPVDAQKLRDTVHAIAAQIASKHPDAARYTKRCIRAVEWVSPLRGYILENELAVALRATGVTDELIGAFLKRSKQTSRRPGHVDQACCRSSMGYEAPPSGWRADRETQQE